ncbi:MAG: [Fe-Fe] hydrogenase large subunit C-terminal domain-containing protein [Bacteroidales bacterium]|nr:[Fe-Fe] hydrogenase large subunit C-terminal domain-containing protein [Bacteroidales bacterium]MDT8431060.1 [Fe-Fe] hydrogenase large subunit C-terminal domain-containing protein [Bacteroidales bacterium]
MIKIEVNKKAVSVEKGQTILSALREHGIMVPTLCSMEELTPTGACRMCVVEVEGFDNLVPACSFKVQEWMKIKTHSARVLRARKANVELLLSNHPDDCLYCERSGNCELQKLAEDLNVRNRRIQGKRTSAKIDSSSLGIVRDPDKCILCGRCVRVCEEIVGISTIDFERRGDQLKIATAMSEPLQFSSCIDCGQCVVACPTGALIDHNQFQELDTSLDDPDMIVTVQYTPEVTVSLAEAFGFRPGTDMKGIINTALRRIGFDYIFETAFGGDVFIQEQAAELIARFRRKEKMPMITSRCPALVNYVEEFRPELISFLTPVRPPHQIMGKLINKWFATKKQVPSNRIQNVLITNCTAAKYEASRPEYASDNSPDVDYVLTTRELARLIRLNGININGLDPEPADGPFNAITSAGKLLANAGGEAEATTRTVFREISKKEMQDPRITKLRGNKYLRDAVIATPKGDLRVAVVHGLKHALKVMDEISTGKSEYDLIEIMVCREGCVNGGGQPIPANVNVIRARTKTIYDIDKSESLHCAHKNNAVAKMYEEFARAPASDQSRDLFMTRFAHRKVLK